MKDARQDKDDEVRYKANNEWLETSSQWSLKAKRAKGERPFGAVSTIKHLKYNLISLCSNWIYNVSIHKDIKR